MNEIKFSVVTPVYNSFYLMKNFFYSLEKQNYKNFEVIIVDDCSEDDSYIKLLEYQKKAKINLKIFKTEENLGPGNARNIGIKEAVGEWITFIDNDDWVVEDFFYQINELIVNKNPNCIIYDYFIKQKNRKEKASNTVFNSCEGFITREYALENVKNHTVGKFYKLKTIRDCHITFPEIRRCEDVTFTTLALSEADKIYYYNKPLYYYYQRANSLSNKSHMSEKEMVIAFSILQDKLGAKYPKELKEKSVRDLLYGGVLMMCKAKKSNAYILDYIKKYEEKYPDWFECKMVKKIGKPKYIFLLLVKYKVILGLKFLAYVHSKLLQN